MAKKRKAPPKSPPPTAAPERAAVTPDRFARLYRLVDLLGAGPQTRPALIRRLRLDVRGFYRDLELLRSAGIGVTLSAGRYELAGGAEDAVNRLPFPDPHLTFGEAVRLARGRTPAHRKLNELIDRIQP